MSVSPNSTLPPASARGSAPPVFALNCGNGGIESDLVASWLDERDEEWLQLLEEVSCRKFGSEQSADFKERVKRARFLEYRGFPPEMIRRIL